MCKPAAIADGLGQCGDLRFHPQACAQSGRRLQGVA
jgi:hypothetical protein